MTNTNDDGVQHIRYLVTTEDALLALLRDLDPFQSSPPPWCSTYKPLSACSQHLEWLYGE